MTLVSTVRLPVGPSVRVWEDTFFWEFVVENRPRRPLVTSLTNELLNSYEFFYVWRFSPKRQSPNLPVSRLFVYLRRRCSSPQLLSLPLPISRLALSLSNSGMNSLAFRWVFCIAPLRSHLVAYRRMLCCKTFVGENYLKCLSYLLRPFGWTPTSSLEKRSAGVPF